MQSENAIVLATGTALVAEPVDAATVARSEALASRPRSANTAKAYANDWGAFASWCEAHALPALPASEDTIRTYLVALADSGKKHASVARAYASIRAIHADHGAPLPTLATVRNALENLARERGSAPAKKAPLMVDAVKRIAKDEATSVRDRAILLLGFAAALRRSEIVALDVSDLRFTDDGLEVTIRRGKTDQTGQGRVVGVPHGAKGSCPVRAVKAWLAARGAAGGAGPVFDVCDRTVANIVKRAAAAVGLDAEDFSGHSLRAGLATSAAKAGKDLATIMATTGHRSERVARGYIRHASVFDACASEGLL